MAKMGETKRVCVTIEQALKNNNNSQPIITHNNNSKGVHATFAERWRDRLWQHAEVAALRPIFPLTVTIILQQILCCHSPGHSSLLRSVMLASSCRSLKRPAPINASARRCKPRGGGTEPALAAFRSTARSLPSALPGSTLTLLRARLMALGGSLVPTGRRCH